MKVGSDANYNVRVRERGWEEPPEQASLYEGMYTFDVNQVVDISFVPRVTDAGPPWSPDALPDDRADFTAAEQARVLEVLSASYSVTPDDSRAGAVVRYEWLFEWPEDQEQWRPTPTVFFVTTDEFERLTADLAALTEIAGNVHSTVRRDKVADHEVVRFIDTQILESPWLTRDDRVSVGHV